MRRVPARMQAPTAATRQQTRRDCAKQCLPASLSRSHHPVRRVAATERSVPCPEGYGCFGSPLVFCTTRRRGSASQPRRAHRQQATPSALGTPGRLSAPLGRRLMLCGTQVSRQGASVHQLWLDQNQRGAAGEVGIAKMRRSQRGLAASLQVPSQRHSCLFRCQA